MERQHSSGHQMPNDRVFLQKSRWKDVTISYEPISGIFIKRRGSNTMMRFIDADSLANTVFSAADLRRANLRGMNLRGSHFLGVSFHSADLRDADLRGANLSRARGLNSASLDGAFYDAHTRWPAGFDPGRHGAVMNK
jgi:uncharacterized protein YjbI with pentapeptide repeats